MRIFFKMWLQSLILSSYFFRLFIIDHKIFILYLFAMSVACDKNYSPAVLIWKFKSTLIYSIIVCYWLCNAVHCLIFLSFFRIDVEKELISLSPNLCQNSLNLKYWWFVYKEIKIAYEKVCFSMNYQYLSSIQIEKMSDNNMK